MLYSNIEDACKLRLFSRNIMKIITALIACVLIFMAVGCSQVPDSAIARSGWAIESSGVVTVEAAVDDSLLGETLRFELMDFDTEHLEFTMYTPEINEFSLTIAVSQAGNYIPRVKLGNTDVTDSVIMAYNLELPITVQNESEFPILCSVNSQ